jgi:hypothetical protein
LFSTGSADDTGAPVSLRAHVTQADDGSPGEPAEADLLFDLYAAGDDTATPYATFAASADDHGDAIVDVGSLPTGTWNVVVRTDPETGSFEAPDSDLVPISVHAPTDRGSATGVGWVPISSHVHGDFALDTRFRRDGSPTGRLAYSFVDANGNRVVVLSTGWQRGGLAIGGNRATMAGTCSVTVLDPRGHVVSTAFRDVFRLDVSDVPHGDTLALSVYTPEGALSHRVGTPDEPVGLGGGQVVVRP